MSRAWRWAKTCVWLSLGLLCVLQLWFFAHVLWWRWVNPAQSHFMASRLEVLRNENPQARLQHYWVDYEDISNSLKRAVVAAEDDRFMSHKGIDFHNIQRAITRNKQKGRAVVGGSTITQQLAKNLFLSPSRSYWRKAQEAVIALELELLWSKRRILEVYLNLVEWGDGVYGVEAAARHYHHISAAQLSPYQAVTMAVMLPSPRRYERRYPAWLLAHARQVQARMKFTAIP